jgi:hypothetical protein
MGDRYQRQATCDGLQVRSNIFGSIEVGSCWLGVRPYLTKVTPEMYAVALGATALQVINRIIAFG